MKPRKRPAATKSTCSCCKPAAKKGRPARELAQDNGLTIPVNTRATSTSTDPSQVSQSQNHTMPVPDQDPRQNGSPLDFPILPDVPILNNVDDDTTDEDSVPDANIFQDVINRHTHNLLPGYGMQFAEPVSCPIHHQIKQSLRKDIWKNKFIDLASLLPSAHSNIQTTFTLQMNKHSNISVQPSNRLKRINNIETWTSAFIRFIAVYTVKYPHETPQLMKYMEIVWDLAIRWLGQAFISYDTRFRMLRESVIIPWDRLHTELWITAPPTPPQQVTTPALLFPRQTNQEFSSHLSCSKDSLGVAADSLLILLLVVSSSQICV